MAATAEFIGGPPPSSFSFLPSPLRGSCKELSLLSSRTGDGSCDALFPLCEKSERGLPDRIASEFLPRLLMPEEKPFFPFLFPFFPGGQNREEQHRCENTSPTPFFYTNHESRAGSFFAQPAPVTKKGDSPPTLFFPSPFSPPRKQVSEERTPRWSVRLG